MERIEFSYNNNTNSSTNNNIASPKKKHRNKDKNNQRRFSDDQIKQLETMFESETRLEPRKKVEVAKELGLQPRQVAIWFQNKRARWKSKQVEQDLKALRAEYESLASKFETLKQEKHSLISQLEKLNDELVRKEKDEKCKDGEVSTSKIIDDDKSGLAKLSLEERGGFGLNDIEDWSHHNQGKYDNDDVVINTNTSQEQNDVYSLASFENWYSNNKHELGGGGGGGGVFDHQSRGCSQWLNFWC